MGILRTYFTKDNTLIRNSYINTGKNPIVELFHGGSLNADEVFYSRYIFDFNFTEILQKLNTKQIGSLSEAKHVLKITNTSTFDESPICQRVESCVGDVKRATGFDLILFQVPEPWCEGDGYDYLNVSSTNRASSQTYCESSSNWFIRQDLLTYWSNPGIYNNPTNWCSGVTFNYSAVTENSCTGGTSLVLAKQRFEFGNENVNIDITDYINGLISSGYTGLTYGLGLAFDYPLEIAPLEDAEYVGFFGRETNSIYEPYLETTWDDTIKDDRDKFYIDKENSICLYVNAGGQAVNASFSGVTIYDQDDNVFKQIPVSEINQITTGVYCVDFSIDSVSGYCGNVQFKDVWQDVTINNKNLGDVELNFIVLEKELFYNIGSVGSAISNGLGVGGANNLSIYDYEFTVTGLKRKEKIKRGDTRRVKIDVRIPFTFDKFTNLDKVYYRIFNKEIENIQIEYIEWQEVSRTPDGNFFILDTSWFIPNDYYMEIKIESGNEIRTYRDKIEFTIVSEKDY
jgi:hypothetical protein